MKTNEKSQTDQAAPAPAPADRAAVAVAVVQPAPAAQAGAAAKAQSDDFHGRGGLYTRINGVRTRVAVTQPADTKAQDKEAKQ